MSTCSCASPLLSLLFYGWGLGLFGRLSEAQGMALALLLFGAQAAFGMWWLRTHRFGPLEWLWPSFTYRSLPPLARSAL